MKSKYNIAFIPLNNSREFIKLSHRFTSIADKYLLGENSLPHVTISQFMADETEIQALWNKVCSKLTKYTVELEFNEFSCITFDNNIYWVSLLPAKVNELVEINKIIDETLKKETMNSSKKYDPHLTLVNTKNNFYKKLADNISKTTKLIGDRFMLSLGVSDEVGQFKKVLFKMEEKPQVSCKI